MENVIVDGAQIQVSATPGGLCLYPTEWTEEVTSKGFDVAADAILASLPRTACVNPWIIGSASRDLKGTKREDSKSHLSGLAFDMSPMWSTTEALSPDRRALQMAWNVFDIACLAQGCHDRVPYVIEGDHLHVQPKGNPQILKPSEVLSCLSLSTYYPLRKEVDSDRLTSSLVGSLWLFDIEALCFKFVGDDQEWRSRLIKYLG